MTLNSRNNAFLAGLILGVLITLLYVLGALNLILNYPELVPLDRVLANPLTSPMAMIIPIFLLALFLIIAEISIYVSFRKTSSAEIFFFFVFLITTGVECLSLLLVYIDSFDMPFQFAMTVSRAIYFGRFLGSLCILSAGVFACGIPYQRLELMLGACALAALALATTIPLDSGFHGFHLIIENGSNAVFLLGFLLVEILGVLSFLYAVNHQSNNSYFLLALGMALVVTGKNFLYYSNNSLMMAGGYVLLITGTIIFGTKTHEVYLWF